MKALVDQNAWKRTSQFIQDKYGKKIEFRFISETKGDELVFLKGDDLVVTLKHKQESLGNVVVRHGSMLSQEEQTEAADLIQFLIGPQAYSSFLQLKLSKPESTEQEENVINLFSLNSVEIEDAEVYEIDSEEKELLSKFIHIKAKSRLTRHKIAMKLHEMTGSIVFLRLQDIAPENEKINMEMDLTDTALFIEDIKDLGPNQLKLLEKLAKNKSKNSVVLVGSELDEQAIQKLDCAQDLKNDLIGMMYDADRVPAVQQASTEVLELLFFKQDGGFES